MFDLKDQEYWLLLNVSVGKIKIGLQANAGLHTYRQRNVYLSVGFSYLFDDPKPSTSTVILGDLIKQWLHQGRLFLDIGDIEDLRLCDLIKCKMCSCVSIRVTVQFHWRIESEPKVSRECSRLQNCMLRDAAAPVTKFEMFAHWIGFIPNIPTIT